MIDTLCVELEPKLELAQDMVPDISLFLIYLLTQ